MKVIASDAAAGLNGLSLVVRDDPGLSGVGQIRVRVHASSLNFHDLGVITGRMKADVGRIPMADGASVVEAVGPRCYRVQSR